MVKFEHEAKSVLGALGIEEGKVELFFNALITDIVHAEGKTSKVAELLYKSRDLPEMYAVITPLLLKVVAGFMKDQIDPATELD